jgi:hypothetical protein
MVIIMITKMGAVWVINYGNQIAVITGQHNRNMACFCKQKYEYWRRFFNSFTVKILNRPKTQDPKFPGASLATGFQ